ncbi:TadE/TadG family type IV pilus assembly protein [Microbacterium lacus]|uniref:TadE/TadG family type IV pilus assembly protein n=1 Tax=Microbacterium lacus TaxID=415217 RepID=UPI001E30D034|nr:TadE/TadG family type IV pilus assembly protein [Microbacterium lacus]
MNARRVARLCRVVRLCPTARLGDRGSVAAEFAVTLPAALLLILIGIGAVSAGAQTARLQGAAADAARLIARGEVQLAESLVGRVPGAAAMRADEGDRLVCVTLSAPVAVPGLAAAGFDASARACAAAGGG